MTAEQSKRIAIVVNKYDDHATRAYAELLAWSQAKDIVAFELGAEGLEQAHNGACNLVVALGGDGTILRSVHESNFASVPILGIKFGRLGFLSGAPADELFESVELALSGQVAIESRAVLNVSAYSCAESLGSFRALNEVLLSRASHAGIIKTRLSINGQDVYEQRGDGMIVATATGSTAYALSVGGPILSPTFQGMTIAPLASHTLINRAIVTAPEDNVAISLSKSSQVDSTLAIDGNIVLDAADIAKPITHIEIRKSDKAVSLVKTSGRLFFETLAAEFFHLPQDS
jgi:NAD+ kinase